ncbi:hypothetical protein LCM28_05645 [Salipiger pacificus]|nr:hypothetical protein [Alloyangia pacifica]
MPNLPDAITDTLIMTGVGGKPLNWMNENERVLAACLELEEALDAHSIFGRNFDPEAKQRRLDLLREGKAATFEQKLMLVLKRFRTETLNQFTHHLTEWHRSPTFRLRKGRDDGDDSGGSWGGGGGPKDPIAPMPVTPNVSQPA